MDAHGHLATVSATAPAPPTTEYRRLLKSLREDRRNARRHLEVARFLVRMRHYHRALSNLRVAKALQPRRSQTYLLLGLVYHRIDNLPQAVVAYRQLLRVDPSCRAAHYQLAIVLIEQGKESEATTHLKRVVELNPRTRKAFTLLADIAQRAGDLNRALSHLEHVIPLAPKDHRVYVQIGRLHREAGRPDRAVVALEKALALAPRQLEARIVLGQVLLDEGLPDKALAIALDGLATDPNHIELRLIEGRSHEALDDRTRALTAYITAARSSVDDYRPHLALGKLYTVTGDFELAEEELNRALAVQEREQSIYRARSQLYLASGMADKADRALVEMTEVFSTSPEAWRLLGELRHRITRLDEAVSAFTKAIELAPADASLFCARAKSHVKRGAYDDAVADFQRARDLDPDSEEARAETDLIRGHKNLREALNTLEQAEDAREKGDYHRARTHFATMLELVPNNVSWLDQYATLSVYCGEYGAAVESLERLLALDTDNGAIPLRLGDLFSALNRFDDAWRLYEQCVLLEPLNIPARIRIIRTLGHRAIARTLSPDKYPRLAQAYRAGLEEPSKLALAHLELAYLDLCFGSQIFPRKEWQQRAHDHFAAVGERCSEETLRYRYLGEMTLARSSGADDEAIAALQRLCHLVPQSEDYAIALLEYLKCIRGFARGFRLSQQFVHRFPNNGLIRALDLEFFAHLAGERNDPRSLCRKRLNELQRQVAEEETGSAYLNLALGLMILSPAGERFESGRKVTIALNRARSLAPDSPWPLWALLREQLRSSEDKKPASPGSSPQAVTICRNGLRRFPTFVPFIEHIGRIGLQSTDPVEVDRGRALLERAVITCSDAAGALFSLGRHYEKLGDVLTARLYYAKVLECPRGTAYAKMVLERLRRLVS